MKGFNARTGARRRWMQAAAGAVALILVACGVKGIAPLWSADITVAGANLISPPTTATRELADNRLRVVYQRDAQTLVADTYSVTGALQDHREFAHPATNRLGFYHQPLFLSDDVVIWIGESYEQSVRLDLASDSLTSLPALDDILPADTRFLAAQSLLLEDGTLILAGRDVEEAGQLPADRARIVALASDGSIQTQAVDSRYGFSGLTPIAGTTRYLVSLPQSDPGLAMWMVTYEGEGATLSERTDLAGTIFNLSFADAAGVWGTGGGFSPVITHTGPAPALTWEMPGYLLQVVPTSAGDYLVCRVLSGGKPSLSRMTAEGTILWDVALAPGMVYPGACVTESNGRILLTESSYDLADGVRVEDQDGTSQTLLTTTVKYKVWHRLLDMNGKEQARFAEPAYRGVFIKDVEHLTLGPVLEYTAGSCDPDYVVPLASGDFASVSRWCTESRFDEHHRKLFYFNVP